MREEHQITDYREAANRWYGQVYRQLWHVIRERRLTRFFPGDLWTAIEMGDFPAGVTPVELTADELAAADAVVALVDHDAFDAAADSVERAVLFSVIS